MSSIDIEHRDLVAVITMNNPASKNALDLEMRRAVLEAVRKVSEDDAVRAVVLTGAGNAFCAGADVGKMGGRGLAGSRQRMKTMHAMVRAVHGMDKPVIAAVRGPAVGIGFSLAMACDIVVAAPEANFSQVFTQVGLAPDGGAIWFLARQMGFARAKELVFSARKFTGEEAAALGLVQRLVSTECVLDEALALAAQYAQGPSLALTMAKQLFAHSVSPTLEQFLEMELLVGPQLSQTHDHAEGRAAFKERRMPQFTGE